MTPHQALRQQAAEAAWEAMDDARAAHDPDPRVRVARAAADAVVGVVLDAAVGALCATPCDLADPAQDEYRRRALAALEALRSNEDA
jgi:hypothetical protein